VICYILVAFNALNRQWFVIYWCHLRHVLQYMQKFFKIKIFWLLVFIEATVHNGHILRFCYVLYIQVWQISWKLSEVYITVPSFHSKFDHHIQVLPLVGRMFLYTISIHWMGCKWLLVLVMFIIPSPTKLRRDIVTLPSVHPSFRNILIPRLKNWPGDLDLWPWKSIGFQILLRTKYVPSLVKIHWRMLILECSQGCYGRMDGR
jgi:hypothetical protein